MNYKVLLPTSGTGSRLGDITKHTNKALVPLNGRPAVEYILASYAKDVPVVVTLGYRGEDVKKHRVIAISDLILQEVSPPEVDDVIRIEDDANRPDGKIESEHRT
jgi:dTDP-glucose pyrophosphorylase